MAAREENRRPLEFVKMGRINILARAELEKHFEQKKRCVPKRQSLDLCKYHAAQSLENGLWIHVHIATLFHLWTVVCVIFVKLFSRVIESFNIIQLVLGSKSIQRQ